MFDKDFELNLVISSFITHDRKINTCNRFEMFLCTLHSYSKIQWDNIYLFIDLDFEFSGRENEIVNLVKDNFLFQNFYFKNNRILTQASWQEFFHSKLAPKNLFWFTQNDDHPYLDNDIKYLYTGCEILKDYSDVPASLYLSHWPEMLKLSGKNKDPIINQNFIEFDGFLIDAIQVFNSELIKAIFFEKDWEGKEYKRIDTLLRDKFIWGDNEGNIVKSDQKILVPLKELCRKFSGYGHVNMTSVSPLRLTYSLVSEQMTKDSIQRIMTAKHQSLWTENNSFEIKDEWIDISCNLYGKRQRKLNPIISISIKHNTKSNFLPLINHYLKKIKRSRYVIKYWILSKFR